MNDRACLKLMIREVPNGIVLPQKEANNGPLWGLGGVCDEFGEFIQESFYDGGWATHGGKYEWPEEELADFPVVYIGMYYSHWGHFLVDLTNRFWALKELHQEHKNIKIAYLGEEKISGNNLEFFRLLGFQESDFCHVLKPTRFSKVYVPQQAFKACEWYTKEHISMLDSVVDIAMHMQYNFSKFQNMKKVYFTRRTFGKALESEFGEIYFEQYFAHNGFDIVAPEKLSLMEQIYIWNHAEEIVSVNGSIPLNVMLCKNAELKLTILNKTSITHENPFLLLKMRGIKSSFIDVYEEPFKRYPKSLGKGPFLMMPSMAFYEYCKLRKYDSPFSADQERRLLKSEKMKYYRYVFDIKRRLKIWAIQIVYKYRKKR